MFRWPWSKTYPASDPHGGNKDPHCGPQDGDAVPHSGTASILVAEQAIDAVAASWAATREWPADAGNNKTAEALAVEF